MKLLVLLCFTTIVFAGSGGSQPPRSFSLASKAVIQRSDSDPDSGQSGASDAGARPDSEVVQRRIPESGSGARSVVERHTDTVPKSQILRLRAEVAQISADHVENGIVRYEDQWRWRFWWDFFKTGIAIISLIAAIYCLYRIIKWGVDVG